MAVHFDLEFTLHSQATPVPVRLRRVGERWIARALGHGRDSVGVGATPRAALEASLQPLGPSVARSCLADLALLGPSLQLARVVDQ